MHHVVNIVLKIIPETGLLFVRIWRQICWGLILPFLWTLPTRLLGLCGRINSQCLPPPRGRVWPVCLRGRHALPPCTASATAQTSHLNAKLCLLDPLLMCSHTLDFADVGTQLATSLHHFLTQDKDIRLNVSVSLINSCSIFLGKTLTFSYLDCYYYNRHPTTPLCVFNLSGSVHWRMLPD